MLSLSPCFYPFFTPLFLSSFLSFFAPPHSFSLHLCLFLSFLSLPFTSLCLVQQYGAPMPGMPAQGMPGMPGMPPQGMPMGGPPGGGYPPQAGAYPGTFAPPPAQDPMWGYFTAIAGQVSGASLVCDWLGPSSVIVALASLCPLEYNPGQKLMQA